MSLTKNMFATKIQLKGKKNCYQSLIKSEGRGVDCVKKDAVVEEDLFCLQLHWNETS